MSRSRTRRIAKWTGLVVCVVLWALLDRSQARCWEWKMRFTFVPLLIALLPIAIAIPTAWLWLRDSRYPPGHCQKCGYDLTGNVTGVCSECEEPISTEKT